MTDYSDRIVEMFGVYPAPRRLAWAAAERSIGIDIPADYRSMVDRLGASILDDWLCVYEPDSSRRHADIAVLAGERDLAWQVFRRSGVPLREDYFLDGRRLVAFAAIEANYFFWRVEPDGSTRGVVVVDADLDGWHDFDMSATECIHRVLTGRSGLDIVDDLFPRSPHTHVPM